MKILVVSNYYPPHEVGGYELLCRDVAERLAARGHDIRALTATYGVERGQHPDDSSIMRASSVNTYGSRALRRVCCRPIHK